MGYALLLEDDDGVAHHCNLNLWDVVECVDYIDDQVHARRELGEHNHELDEFWYINLILF